MNMSNLINNRTEADTAVDPIIDPVSYLADLGIEAELVSVEETDLAEAA